jgi:hypothetical protein
MLDASALHLFAQCDGDCLAWLARLSSIPLRSSAPPDWNEIVKIEHEMDQLEFAILKSVPPSHHSAVANAHQVAMLIVDEDEIYEGISEE